MRDDVRESNTEQKQKELQKKMAEVCRKVGEKVPHSSSEGKDGTIITNRVSRCTEVYQELYRHRWEHDFKGGRGSTTYPRKCCESHQSAERQQNREIKL